MQARHILLIVFALMSCSAFAEQACDAKCYETEKYIPFNLVNERLVDLITKLASRKKVNPVLPQNDTKLSAITVNFRMPHKITIQKAWDLMTTMLKIAGYSLVYKKDFIQILATTDINGVASPIYINEPLVFLPNNDSTIRYIYYFENINLGDQSSNSKANLTTIFNDMLPQAAQQNFIFDETFNCVMVTGSSRNIKDVMRIVQELDQTGFREAALVIPLEFATAADVVATLNKLIPGADQQDSFRFPSLLNPKSDSKGTYFADSTRLVAIERTNSVAILGLKESVAKASDFIKKYLDKPVDSDRITIHVKPLQYLKAEDLAQVMTNLINQQGQSQSTSGETGLAGRILKGVIVVAEKTEAAAAAGGAQIKDTNAELGATITTQNQGAMIGGNNLIVGARQRDWVIVERIIDQLDTLQRQVALEVLVVNLSVAASKALGAQLRGIANAPLPHNEKWQAANLTDPILNTTTDSSANTIINSVKGLDSNLLQPTLTNNVATNLATQSGTGATILTFKDNNGIAGVMKILSTYTDATVVSQPYVITTNHKQADISIISTRVVQGSADPQSTGGPVTINNDKIYAALTVNILPRISGDARNINLEIIVRVNEFSNPDVESGNNTILKRTVQTNANVFDKQVLVLGGLATVRENQEIKETPLLGRIPIIGNLFKNQTRDYANQSIMIFISPTIINPRLGGGSNEFTTNKYLRAREAQIEQMQIFHNLRDPITKYFFSPATDAEQIRSTDAFMDRGEYDTGVGYEPGQVQGAHEQKQTSQSDIVAIKDVLKDLKENPLKEAAKSK